MKLAILSDVHGNARALDAVLADLARDPADRVICLGDAVQGGAEPAETVARLRGAQRVLGGPIVMGNADAFLLSGVDTSATPPPPERRGIDPWAEYAVLSVEGERVALEFRRVPYDVAGYVARLRSSGRPHAEDAIGQFRVTG
jgi:predicted phosphodiesterase